MPRPNHPDANETITLLLDPAITLGIRAQAKQDGVSINDVIVKTLKEALNKLEHNEPTISTQHLSEGTGDRSLSVR